MGSCHERQVSVDYSQNESKPLRLRIANALHVTPKINNCENILIKVFGLASILNLQFFCWFLCSVVSRLRTATLICLFRALYYEYSDRSVTLLCTAYCNYMKAQTQIEIDSSYHQLDLETDSVHQ